MDQSLDKKRVFRAELHTHTPSSNCYKGSKTDDEYLKIIETAHKNQIDILAITDHNSIEGFIRIRDLKTRIQNEYSALASISDSKEAKIKSKLLHQSLIAFDSIFLIPGVEFEVNNGIHLLVLFNPETPVTTIEQFLIDGGYNTETFGKENDAFSNWSIFDLYKESNKYDCVVIDAHSDSNKGIFNTLEGQPRVHAFIDTTLSGICYKSETQKNNIERILSQYSRKSPVAFLKSSDAHQISEIGKDVSFFRLEDCNWTSFKDAFSNPAECVFTTYPQTHSILKKVASSGLCLFIKSIDNDNTQLYYRYICGLANSNGGFIIIGAESINAINGISDHNLESVESVFNSIRDMIPGLSSFSINVYPIRDNYLVFVTKVSPSEDLLSIANDDHIYFYNETKLEVLDASRIQNLITQRLTQHFSEKINSDLDSIRKKTTAIDTYIKSLPILSSYYNRSYFLSSIVSKVEPIDPVHLSAQQFANLSNSFLKHENGVSRGNVYYFEDLQKPRLNEAYLRISLPRFNVRGLGASKEGPALFFIPGGAVYYSDKVPNCYYKTVEPVLKVQVKNDYPIKFLCAYLKSSFFLWYILNKYNTIDVIPPYIFNNIRIPQIHLKNPNESALIAEIENLFDQIVCAEKSFLVKQNSISDEEELVNVIIAHNESVKSCFETIDELVFSLLRLTEIEKKTVLDNLRANSIFVPDSRQ